VKVSYILASKKGGTLYVGVPPMSTSNGCFTDRYGVIRLVYQEFLDTPSYSKSVYID
jgi:predicted GIY-YIG superfamily endonuclease